MSLCGIASIGREAHMIWCFPLLPTPEGSASWSAQTIEDLFGKNPKRSPSARHIVESYVYLHDLSDGDILADVVHSLAEVCPRVTGLTVSVVDPDIHNVSFHPEDHR